MGQPKGCIPWNKGKHLPPLLEITKQRISDSLKGHIPWGRKKNSGFIPWNKGKTYTLKPMSEETKQKISKSLKGKPSKMIGRKHSEQHILNNRLSHLGKVSVMKGKHSWYRGELHARWKGGITSENQQIRHSIEYKLWKDSVFARDHWNCQNCGKIGGDMHAHHIKGFASNPELRFAIDNGITLCLDCHRKVHTKQKPAEEIIQLVKQREE